MNDAVTRAREALAAAVKTWREAVVIPSSISEAVVTAAEALLAMQPVALSEAERADVENLRRVFRNNGGNVDICLAIIDRLAPRPEPAIEPGTVVKGYRDGSEYIGWYDRALKPGDGCYHEGVYEHTIITKRGPHRGAAHPRARGTHTRGGAPC